MGETLGDALEPVVVFALVVAGVGGWLQHLYSCFTEELWGFLVAGALFFPVGVIHGWGIWFGFWA